MVSKSSVIFCCNKNASGNFFETNIRRRIKEIFKTIVIFIFQSAVFYF
jgi:hypothetical protein